MRRGLAGPIGPEQPHHLPGLGAERDAVDRPEAVLVGLDHVVDHQRHPDQVQVGVGGPLPPLEHHHGHHRSDHQQRDHDDQRQRHLELAGVRRGQRDLRQGQRSVPAEPDLVDRGGRGQRVRLVGAGDDHLQPVIHRHLVGDRRQRHGDLGGLDPG